MLRCSGSVLVPCFLSRERNFVKSRTNPPTGRLGCFHFGLPEPGQRLPAIPQPGRLGIFQVPASAKFESHRERSPTSRLGDLRISPARSCRLDGSIPTSRLGFYAVSKAVGRDPLRLSQTKRRILVVEGRLCNARVAAGSVRTSDLRLVTLITRTFWGVVSEQVAF